MLEHALDRVGSWAERWGVAGGLVLLLDFDGTLAPIVDTPEAAAMPDLARSALVRLTALPGVTVAIVSGRGLADVRERAGIGHVAYAGNHGMEIEGPGLRQLHPEAAAARPALERAAAGLRRELAPVAGTLVEDKLLTLSVHYRRAAQEAHAGIRAAVEAAVAPHPTLRTTEGKMVLEVRPAIEWDKGRAVLFLLDHTPPPAGAPVLYIGDDRTDEDAFRALAESGRGEGIVVADPPPASSAARTYLRNPVEVGRFLAALADLGPAPAPPQPEG